MTAGDAPDNDPLTATFLKNSLQKTIMRPLKGLFAFLLIGVAFFPGELRGNHLYGGEITWDCAGGGDHEFHLTLYRDCDGSSAPSSAQLDVYRHPSLNSIPLSFDSISDISPECKEVSGGSSAIECSSGGNGAVQAVHFSSSPTSLSGTPPNDGWVFAWSGQTRSGGPSNYINPDSKGITIRSVMYGTGSGVSPCADASPRFEEPPVTIVCKEGAVNWQNFAIDPDTDSISYSWGQPLDKVNGSSFDPPSDPAQIPFSGSYTFDQPLPGIGAGTGSASDQLDPSTGELALQNPSQGEYGYVVKVSSYRDGEKTAEVFRESGLVIADCSNNSSPTIEAPFAGSFSDTFQVGQNVSFPIRAFDTEDLQDGSPQTVHLDVGGVAFGQNYNDPGAGCPEPPCATLSNAPTVSSTDTVQTSFDWDLDCSHLSEPGDQGAGAYKTYLFSVEARDDHCSVPGRTQRTIRITVENEDPVPAPELNCVSHQGSDVELSWTPPSGSFPSFQGYVIFKADDENGPYTPIDTIAPLGSSAYTDAGAAADPDAFYFIRSLSGCQGKLLSSSSDTLQRLDLDVTDPSNGTAVLEWNELATSSNPPNPGTGYYRILKEHPMGTWTLIDSVPYGTTEYLDTIMVCSDSLSYRIEVADHDRGCISASNIDGGNFSDVLAPAVPEINNVSVDTSIGKATIDWDPVPQSDTRGYLVLQIIGNNEYVIDTVWGRTNTFYTYMGSNAPINSEHFAIAAFDSCYSGSPPRPNTSTRGIIHNTMNLKGDVDRCNRRVDMTWNPYRNWESGVKEYRVYFLESGRSPQYIGKNSAEMDTGMSHHEVPMNESFCYVVEAVANDGTTALSDKECFYVDFPEPPSYHYLSSASVLPGNEGIEVRSLVDSLAEAPLFRLERVGPNGGFEELGTYPHNGGPEFSITDTAVDPTEGSFSYRVTALDSCRNEILSSNLGKSIHLKADATREPPLNVLQWTSYGDWEGDVSGYEIHRIDREKGVDMLLDVVSPQKRSYEDDVREDVEDENGRYCYYVKALETDNPRDRNEVARSNEACAFQEPYVWIPNAYMVNGTSEDFKPVTGHVLEEGYRMSIYDRWGQRIFETEDPEEGWKGRVNGKELAPEGVYVYHIMFRTSYGKRIEKRGGVTLLHR